MHHLTWSSFRIKAYEKRAKRYHPGTVCRSFRQQRSIAAGEQRIKAAGAVRNLMGRAHCSHPCATGRKNGLSGRAVPNPDGQGRPLRHTSYPFPLFSESLNAKKTVRREQSYMWTRIHSCRECTAVRTRKRK